MKRIIFDGALVDSSLTSAEIRVELDQIIATPEFQHSKRLSALLLYIVNEALEGRSDRIKAVSIAVDVYGRDESFDQQNDTIVRVEAGRLRRRLESYYLKTGRDSSIRINIPKGGYRPIFETNMMDDTKVASSDPEPVPRDGHPNPTILPGRSRTKVLAAVFVMVAMVIAIAVTRDGRLLSRTDESTARPFLAVMPLQTFTDSALEARLAAGIVEMLINDLSQVPGLSVLAHSSALRVDDRRSLKDTLNDLGVTHLLRGGLAQEGDKVRLTIQLIAVDSGTSLWSFRADRPLGKILTLEDELARKIVTGLSVKLEADKAAQLGTLSHIAPEILALYREAMTLMMPAQDRSAVLAARRIFARVKEREPEFAGGFAGMSFTFSSAAFTGSSNDRTQDLERAVELARNAIELDDKFAMGHATLGLATAVGGNPREGLEHTERAAALQPGDPIVKFILGVNYIMVRQPELAIAPFREAQRLDPLRKDMIYINSLGTALLGAGRPAEAMEALEQARDSGSPWGPSHALYLAAAYADIGQDEQARETLRGISDAGLNDNVKTTLMRALPSETDVERILSHFHRLGLSEDNWPIRGS